MIDEGFCSFVLGDGAGVKLFLRQAGSSFSGVVEEFLDRARKCFFLFFRLFVVFFRGFSEFLCGMSTALLFVLLPDSVVFHALGTMDGQNEKSS